MNINSLRKNDYVSTRVGNGYIVSMLKNLNIVYVDLDFVRDMLPNSSCRLEADDINEIISRAYHYEVIVWRDNDTDEIFEFDTLKEARKEFNKQIKRTDIDSVFLQKRDRARTLLDDIDEFYAEREIRL